MSVVGTLGFGLFLGNVAVLEVRVEHQTSEQVALGVGLPVGRRQGKDNDALRVDNQIPPRYGIAARLFAHWNPSDDHDWLAVTTGAGFGWADTGVTYVTADLGAQFGSNGDDLSAYFAPIVAISHPFIRGRAFSRTNPPDTTFYLGFDLGFLSRWNPSDNGGVGFGLTGLMGFANHDAQILLGLNGSLAHALSDDEEGTE